MIGALIVGIVLFIIFSFPATWLLMLFFGNVAPGVGLSFWGALPLGMLVSALIGAAGSQRTSY
jgi:hypothetical protein